MGMKVNRILPEPSELKAEYPLSSDLAALKARRDAEIRDVFTGESDKFIVIIGPCSADNEDSVCEYVSRLGALAPLVSDKLVLIPVFTRTSLVRRAWAIKECFTSPTPKLLLICWKASGLFVACIFAPWRKAD